MSQQAALERKALEQLRRGDLRGARGTLALVAKLRPEDERIRHRLHQVDELISKREQARARMQEEPLHYAHAYIKAGRLQEGLRLLRAALAKDPENTRLRDLALEVARRIRRDEPAPAAPPVGADRSRSPPTRPGSGDLSVRSTVSLARNERLEQLLARVRTRRREPSLWLPAATRG